jgi:signal peptidase I
VKKWLRENRGFIVFLLLLGLFRTAVADWNPIPSGSMRPTLLEGDVVLVNRLAYDLKLPLTNIVLAHTGNPKRGDIVTFFSPKDGMRLIKRIVALPGDRVEMHDKRLIINGRPVTYQPLRTVLEPVGNGNLPAVRLKEVLGGETHTIEWLSGLTRASNFGPLKVPAGSYLVLGDNRDNSADSRYIGFIQRRLLIGRANHILVSANILDDWKPRTGRFWKSLN